MLRVGVCGSSGRMGVAIKEQIKKESDRFDYVLGFANKKLDEQTFTDLNHWSSDLIDVVLDFSLPDSFKKVFNWCSKYQKPLVSGTTGFDVKDYKKKANFLFMHANNYSLGVAGLIKSIEAFKNMSLNAQVWVEDYHHLNKLDSPSGTAVKIKNKIKESFQREDVEINTVRAGSIFGVHSVHIVTEEEWVTLTHEALNRKVFAQGALNALEWLTRQKTGSHAFEDFLGF